MNIYIIRQLKIKYVNHLIQKYVYIVKNQKYKNKYQPIFELIIRACLSGEYEYWNILTYHSYVNESDKSDGISYVKDFASSKNEKLVKNII